MRGSDAFVREGLRGCAGSASFVGEQQTAWRAVDIGGVEIVRVPIVDLWVGCVGSVRVHVRGIGYRGHE